MVQTVNLEQAPAAESACARPVAWAARGRVGRLLARALRPRSPAALVLSLPRSGSSWVGNTLGMSRTALYLREPVTQTLLDEDEDASVVFEADAHNPPPAFYHQAADAAFAALPYFTTKVVKYPPQWSLRARLRRRVVIKEVNPLAAAWYASAYRPHIVYLIRHPAAVAYSYQRLGWTSPQFERLFAPERLAAAGFNQERFMHSFWAEHGAMQAVVHKLTLEALKSYDDWTLVKYEDLCTEPLKIFRELYERAGLAWDARVSWQIGLHTTAYNNRDDVFGYARDSRVMLDSWRSDLPQDVVAQIKEAYLSYSPPYYTADEW